MTVFDGPTAIINLRRFPVVGVRDLRVLVVRDTDASVTSASDLVRGSMRLLGHFVSEGAPEYSTPPPPKAWTFLPRPWPTPPSRWRSSPGWRPVPLLARRCAHGRPRRHGRPRWGWLGRPGRRRSWRRPTSSRLTRRASGATVPPR